MYVKQTLVATITMAAMSLFGGTACRQQEAPPAADDTPTPSSPAPVAKEPGETAAADGAGGAKPDQTDVTRPAGMTDEEFAARAAQKRVLAVQEAQTRLLEKWRAIDKVSVIYESKFERKKDLEQRGETRTKYDYHKTDDTMLIHYTEIMRAIVKRSEEEEVLTGQNRTIIFDGEHEYALQKLHDRQFAYKRYFNPNKIQHVAGQLMFNRLRAYENVERMRPEEVSGRNTEVFAFSNKDKTVHGKTYIDTETGIMVRFEMTSDVSDQTMTANMINLNLEPEFPDDHFTFVLPEGVELKDETLPIPADSSSSANIVLPPTAEKPAKPDSEPDGP